MNQPLPSDGQAIRRYTRTYNYDFVGNILDMIHHAGDSGWTRRYDYSRVQQSAGVQPRRENRRPLRYDVNGNMIRMPHLPLMSWDFKNQLHVSRSRW